jgi:Zn-dependent protease with chaperone function
MLPRDRPSHVRLTLLILEGYAYLAAIIGVFLGAIGLLVWGLAARRPFFGLTTLFIGVPLVVTTLAAIRALFFRLPQPEGITVTTDVALHEMVEEIRRLVQAPPVHLILLGETFNASASQLPRVGLFWTRNVLVIGYPLLAMLPPEHLRAVVAHELGHLSRAHGRFSAWVYRTRLSWWRLLNALDARGSTPAHARFLFRWYVPRLDRYSLAVAREQEVLADRCAAIAAGSTCSAETLVAIEMAASQLERTFWQSVFARVEHDPEPPRPFSEMGLGLWTAIPADCGLVEQLLKQETTPVDTHPSLGDRLSALGEPVRFFPHPARTAGDVYLGSQRDVLVAALDARWQTAHRAEWRRQHDLLRERRVRLRALTALMEPSPNDIFERAQLIEGFDGGDCALPHYREALARGHAAAGLAAGRLLLERDDETAVALIGRAMEDDPSLIPEGCDLLVPYLRRHQRMAEAHRFVQIATRHATRKEMADREREVVSAVDCFVPHTLADDKVGGLAAWLAIQPEIMEAFVVRRERRYSAGSELVCAIRTQGEGAHGIVDRFHGTAALPASKVVLLGRHDQPLRAALESVPGSLVHTRLAEAPVVSDRQPPGAGE